VTSRTTAVPAALAVLLACGPDGSPEVGDRYYGPIDATALDAKLRPATGTRCPTGQSPCYPPQEVSVRGQTVRIYNMGTVSSGLTFTAGGTLSGATFVAGAAYAYHFPDQCEPDLAYDPYWDPYPGDQQFPIFSALPLAPTPPSTAVVLPIVRVVGVDEVADNPCNALKKTASVEAGMFGAVAADRVTAFEARLWAVIDPGAWVVPLSATSTFLPRFGWSRGLIFSYLDGGKVPLNPAGNILVMDGLVVDSVGSGTCPGTGATGCSTLTANRVIILPFGPDEAQYSPIVRLRHFRASGGAAPSAYTAICTRALATGGLPPCTGAPNEVDISSVALTGLEETLIAVGSTL